MTRLVRTRHYSHLKDLKQAFKKAVALGVEARGVSVEKRIHSEYEYLPEADLISIKNLSGVGGSWIRGKEDIEIWLNETEDQEQDDG